MTAPLLLDEFVPTWDHAFLVSRVFRAPPADVLDAITNLDLFRLPVTRVLLEARGLPARLADVAARRRGEAVAPEPPTFRVRDLPARGWLLLGERPGVELACGRISEAWKALGGDPEHPVTAEDFAGFAEPGFAKIAESTVVMPYGTRACVLTLESRVALTDEDSRRLFRRYWLAAGPFIRLMRPAAMPAQQRRLDRQHPPAGRPAPAGGEAAS